jgi:putative membrane protein
MKSILLTTVAALAFPLLAVAQTSGSAAGATQMTAPDSSTEASGSVGMSKLTVQDAHFVKMAAMGGMWEVSDGKVAANQGDATVKNIGNTMVSDHTKANTELASIAKEKGIALPTQVGPKMAASSAKLKGLSGSAFDAYYLQSELKGHEMTIALFKAEASTGSDPDLKAFANSTLPTLEIHLSMIQAAMKGASPAG